MQLLKKAITIIGTLALVLSNAACRTDVNNGGNPDYSALDEFLGNSVWQNADNVRLAGIRLNERREELIAQCMRSAGFDYIPDPHSGRWAAGTVASDETEPNNLDWVVQYGFGVVSGQWQSRFSDSQRLGNDPNLPIFESLSESEQSAFLLALNGSPDQIPNPNMSASDWAEFWRNRGCWGASQQQAFEESPLSLSSSNEFAPLFEAVNEMWTSVFESPNMSMIHLEWSNCMAESGYAGLEQPYDAGALIWDEFNELQIQADVIDDLLLNELRERELSLALVDFNCRREIDYELRRNSLLIAAERRFIDDNREMLEAYRAASEQRN